MANKSYVQLEIMNSELLRLNRTNDIILKASVFGEKTTLELLIEDYFCHVESLFPYLNLVEAPKVETVNNCEIQCEKKCTKDIVKSVLPKFIVTEK